MLEEPKRLGKTVVVAATNTALYTVPAGKYATVSKIAVCNRGASARTFRVAHVDGAIAVVADEDYIVHDMAIAANTTEYVPSGTGGIAMEAADTILVRANHADVNFQAWGVEHRNVV